MNFSKYSAAAMPAANERDRRIDVSLSLLPLAAPAALIAAALLAARRPGRRPGAVPRFAEACAIASVVVALACIVLLIRQGPQTGALAAFGPLVLSVRIDALSVTMLALISFIGWTVLRYCVSYMDGEARQGAFTGWLCATIAAVLLLVMAGDLALLVPAFVATSLCLHKLLLFYPERPAAQRAARKKFWVARAADAFLIAAAVLLVAAFGTGDVAAIAAAARDGAGSLAVSAAAGCLAIAALLKSAQFPSHGWLTEVMEAPTPVSATLHAGVINAGGFLLIRFGDVMLQAPGVLAVVAMIGGVTALIGGLVMLTQPAVKTSLAWSTIAQMGFMMLQCGLGLFALALLHIVAHSLYKAHAFLSAGGAVERVSAIRRPGPVATPGPGAVGRAFLAALAMYAATGVAFGFWHKSPQALALGAILIFGVAYLFAQGFADAAPRALTKRIAVYSVGASLGYFSLHIVAEWLTAGAVPPPPPPGPLEWAVLALAVASFGLVAVAQATFPLWAYHPAAAGLRVHLANGLYANAIFDRLLGSWSLRKS